jgi:hypothetical protein
VRTPYLRVVGLQPEEDGAGRTVALFSPEEEEEFRAMVRYVAPYSGTVHTCSATMHTVPLPTHILLAFS